MIRPINRHVLIEVQKEKETASGIILATESQVALEKATVLAKDENIDTVNVGDEIYYKLYSLSTVSVDGVEYAFLKEDEILGVV